MDEIQSDYEKDMESNWAIVGLEKEVQKAKDRQKAREELMAFLDENPRFKQFYLLTEAIHKY